MTLAKKLKKIYRKEDWKQIFLKGYKESGRTKHLKETVNVPLYNEHEDEILDYFEDDEDDAFIDQALFELLR